MNNPTGGPESALKVTFGVIALLVGVGVAVAGALVGQIDVGIFGGGLLLVATGLTWLVDSRRPPTAPRSDE